jgi:hypothetical protein
MMYLFQTEIGMFMEIGTPGDLTDWFSAYLRTFNQLKELYRPTANMKSDGRGEFEKSGSTFAYTDWINYVSCSLSFFLKEDYGYQTGKNDSYPIFSIWEIYENKHFKITIFVAGGTIIQTKGHEAVPLRRPKQIKIFVNEVSENDSYKWKWHLW